ncbi:MAG: hypothetical protein A2Y33_03050 [Spirochaetes bacterium GWF1_51_8]|nr:MAG: hypothetical protein A2Y33_03050 [Spirochaetes bacterium GWF1_51_8]
MIRLIDSKAWETRGLPAERIVNVRVIEQNGERASAEINGIRVDAKIEGDVPASFLAFAERTPEGMKLRVLSGIKESPLFAHIARDKLLDNLRVFLLQNGFPLDERHLNMSLLLSERGLRLSRENLKALLMASARYGDGFAETIAGLMAKGIVPDEDFPEFFFRIRDILREMMKHGEPPADGQKSAADTLKEFLGFIAGGGYKARLIEHNGKSLTVQSRVVDRNGRKRFYFDLSSENTGALFITADLSEEGYRITVYIGRGLFTAIKDKIETESAGFYRTLREKLPEFRFAVSYMETEDDFMFFRAEGDGEDRKIIPELDIFI